MKRILLFAFLMLLAVPAFATNYYVRDGASGSTCADWGANACDQATTAVALLTRSTDDVIYVADGSYAATDFNTATSGTHLFTIKHATIADHGTSTGWSDSYGDGAMAFANVIFTTAYWTFDGITGGGPGSWTSGFGCTFSSAAGTNVDYVYFELAAHHVTVRHCSFTQTGDIVVPQIANAFKAPGEGPGSGEGANYRLLEYNYVDNISGLPFFFRFGDNAIIQYNFLGHYCGISGDNPDNHCEMLVEWGMNDLEFRYNYVRDAISSGSFVHNDRDAHFPVDSNRVHIYGNVFRGVYGEGVIVCSGADSGHGASVCGDWRVFNNTVAYENQPIHPFFASETDTTGTLIYNNILDGYNGLFYLYNISSSVHDYALLSNFDGMLASGTAACTLPLYAHDNGWTNHASGPCDDVTDAATGISTDIFLDYLSHVPEDFQLRAHVTGAMKDGSPISAAGIDVCTVMGVTCDATQTYNTDMLGVTRGVDGTYDRGAFQFVSGDCTPAKLLFSAQPSSAVLSATLGTVSVGVYDADDNLCTSATDSITLSKNGSATWGTLASGSSLTKSAVAGVATWTDLSVTTTAGAGSIDAAASGLTGATSNSITISAPVIGSGGGALGRLRMRIR